MEKKLGSPVSTARPPSTSPIKNKNKTYTFIPTPIIFGLSAEKSSNFSKVDEGKKNMRSF